MNPKALEIIRAIMAMSMYEAQAICRDIKGAVISIANLELPPAPGHIRVYSHDNQKICCIKWVRALTGLGLREANDLVDRLDYERFITVKLPHPESAAAALADLMNSCPGASAEIIN